MASDDLRRRAVRYGLNPEKTIYTPAELAGALMKSRKTVYRWLGNGLASYLAGPAGRRITLAAVVAYLDAINAPEPEPVKPEPEQYAAPVEPLETLPCVSEPVEPEPGESWLYTPSLLAEFGDSVDDSRARGVQELQTAGG